MPPLTDKKLELKLQDWNEVVSDETQCMRLSQADEIQLLSSRNDNSESTPRGARSSLTFV